MEVELEAGENHQFDPNMHVPHFRFRPLLLEMTAWRDVPAAPSFPCSSGLLVPVISLMWRVAWGILVMCQL